MTYPNSPGFAPTETSIQAAASIAQSAPALRELVFAVIKKQPSTCWEIEEGQGLSHQTTSARITELRLAGRIEASGATRPTNSGRQAIVWQAVERAQ